MNDVVLNLAEIRAKIDGRAQLVAVSKTFGTDDIIPVLNAGQRLFGENRVQEAASKWPGLRTGRSDIELHLIGPLQSNKAAEAVALFDVIQTIDRHKIAEAVARESSKAGKRPRCFIQVNIGHEPQKAGIGPHAVQEFLDFCQTRCGLPISGLMCIPPLEGDPRPYFHALASVARDCGLSELSMGMSGDFVTAIEEGATLVRIGSALFGKRPQITR